MTLTNSDDYNPPPPSTIMFTPAPVLRDDGELTVASYYPPSNAPTTPTTTPYTPLSYNNSSSNDNNPYNPYHQSTSLVPATPIPDSAEITVASSSSTPNVYGHPNPNNYETAMVVANNNNHETAMVVANNETTLTTTDSNNENNALVPAGPVGVRATPHKTYPPKIEKMKKNRKRLTVAAGVTGGLVGLVALGPLGAVVGGAGGAMATRAIGKRRERKKRERFHQKKIAQEQAEAPEIGVHSGEFL